MSQPFVNTAYHTKLNFLRHEYTTLLILTIVTFISRFYQLGEWSFWFDEMYTTEGAYTSAFPPSILYILTRVSFELFGLHEFSARFFSSIAGTIVIPLFYLILKNITDNSSTLLTLVFIVLSPWHLFHSQSARYYAMLFLLTGLAAFLFYYGVSIKNVKLIFISLFLTLLSVFVHANALLLLPSLLTFVLLYFTSSYKHIKISRTAIIISVLIFLFVCGLISPLAIYVTEAWLNFGLSWGYGLPHLIMGIIYNVGVPIVLLAFFSLILLLYERQILGIFLACYTIIPLIVVISVGQFANVRQDYLFFSVPGYFLLAAIGCSRIYNILKTQQLILGIAFLCIILTAQATSLVSYYSDGNRHPEKEAAQFIKDRLNDGDIVLSLSPGVINHYTGVDAENINRVDLESYKENKNRLWIVVYYNRNGMNGIKPDVKKWIYNNCRLVAEIIPKRYDYHDNSMRIFLFEPF